MTDYLSNRIVLRLETIFPIKKYLFVSWGRIALPLSDDRTRDRDKLVSDESNRENFLTTA